jgi:hypothetical protein
LTALVDESGMIITQKGKHNRSKMVAVHGTPFSIPPRNSNNNSVLLVEKKVTYYILDIIIFQHTISICFKMVCDTGLFKDRF